MELAHLVGKKGDYFKFKVDLRHILKFAQAIGDSNPVYTDEEYAKTTINGGIIAPPTFPVAIANDSDQLNLDLDYRRMLHGEQQFIYTRPIRPGDLLTCQTIVSDVYEREGKQGTMEFIVLDTEMYDQEGKHVVTSRTNIVYRPVVKA